MQPHDALFRSTLSTPAHAAALLGARGERG
jgi:hypothetical protein